MRFTFILITLAIFGAVFFSPCQEVFASETNTASSSAATKTIEDEIGQSIIHPASFFYFLKMFREEIEMKTAQTSSAKMARYLEFATRRIREVRALISVNREDLIEPTLEKYWIHLEDLIEAFNSSDLRRNSEIEWQVYEQLYILNKVYSQMTNKWAKIAIRRTIYKISGWDSSFAGKLIKLGQTQVVRMVYEHQKIGCDFLEKVASDSALNEVEKSLFSERAGKCNEVLRR